MIAKNTVLAVGFSLALASGMARADHDPGHASEARGGLKGLEERIWDLETRPDIDTDTNAATECDGPRVFLDGEGSCVPVPDAQEQLNGLDSRISAEEQARLAADQDLRSAIAAETAARISADAAQRELSLIASYLGQDDFVSEFPVLAFKALHCTAGDGSAITVSLDQGAFNGIAFAGRERISAPFSYRVAFESATALDGAALAGGSAVVSVSSGPSTALFSGVVGAGGLVAVEGGLHIYAIEIRPELSQLQRNTGYRIWQGLKVDEIVQQVLADAGVGGARFQLTDVYSPREFVMQYDESDLNFVSRLMEHEGIYFYFDNNGVLTIGDDASLNAQSPDMPIYSGHLARPLTGTAAVTTLHAADGIPGGTFSVDSYDFERPDLDLLQSATAGGTGDSYEFRQSITDIQELDRQADVDRDRSVAAASRLEGTGNNPGFRAGLRTSITDNSGGPFGGSYLLTRVNHAAVVDLQNRCITYANQFEATPQIQAYRPPRLTPESRIPGPTTAKVVGPAGEEIHTDEFGRVKVQFHWDREGQSDENSSAWIRVMLPAGRLDATPLFIPEIGDEVVVGFLEGDPDQPIVIGSVYNGNHLPPE